MPHTSDILPVERYAVVSCHVERPLDDPVWELFSGLQERRPGGFRIAALMRPPDGTAGERTDVWLERARAASARGPLGLHVHWTGPGHARPTGGDPAAAVREAAGWLREQQLEARLFCGGGWYFDAEVAAAVADAGYADCTGTAFRPSYLAPGEARLQADEPAWLELPRGDRLLELPTTHSLGMLARGALAPLPRFVHAYFHDYDLTDSRRRALLVGSLAVLGRRRRVTDLGALQRGLRPAKTMSFANSRG